MRSLPRAVLALTASVLVLVATSGAAAATPSRPGTESSAAFTAGAGLGGIAAGPDGTLWIAETSVDRIARVTTAGVVTEVAAGITPGGAPPRIAAGPGGATL